MSDIVVFIFMGFFFFVILFIKGKVKQKEVESFEEKKKEVHPPSSHRPLTPHKTQTHHLRAHAPSYEVEEKKKYSLLRKGWRGKSSIKQAFILSEILKRREDL